MTGLIHMLLLIERYTAKTRHQPQRSPPLQLNAAMCVPDMYAIVDKCKKKGPEKETGEVVMITHKDEQ